MAELQTRPYSLDVQVGFLMRKANQRHLAIFSRAISELTPTQFATLARLDQQGPLSQNDLGRQTAMDGATIKGVIDRLVKKGFVQTTRDPNDGRRRIVAATNEGAELFAACSPIAHAITAETLTPLTSEEAATFTRLLAKLADPEAQT